MAALQCEICGGKLVGKPGGIFECDSCGMEYSTEWAKAKIQEIKGTVKVEGTVEVQGTVQVEGTANAESLLKRGYMRLEEWKWAEADGYFEKVLDIQPENARAYLGKLLAAFKLTGVEKLAQMNDDFTTYKNWKKAEKYADNTFAEELKGIVQQKTDRLEAKRIAEEKAVEEWRLVEEKTAEKFKRIQKLFRDPNCPVLISAGSHHTVGLRTDGTVVACGATKHGSCSVNNWHDVVSIAAGDSHTVGVCADGTVVATKFKGDQKYYHGRCEVGDWHNIVAIAAGGAHTVGLCADGTVVACGENRNEQCDVGAWHDIVSVAAGWHTVGLCADGHVVACGSNYDGKCDVDNWRNIVAIAAGSSHTVGLRANGTVVARGSNNCGQCKVGHWRNVVAIAAGNLHTIGLCADGRVVACGDNKDGQCDVDNWRNIVAIAAGFSHTVGLRADGIVVACGVKGGGQCNVGKWRLFQSETDLETAIEQHRIVVEKVAEKARQEKIEALNSEKEQFQTELANLKGLFTGKRRNEIEARLAEIDAELSKLNG